MKANELRIGNLIYKHFENGEGVLELVTARTIFDCQVNPTGKFHYTPIPLTAEILQKAGFVTVTKNQDGSYNFWGKDIDASVDVEGELFNYRICENKRTKSINYVHQLQNLYYALTGQELEIEL